MTSNDRLKIISVVGARPQFIKLAPCSAAFKEEPKINEIVVHTGQHYDNNMSQFFFDELKLPIPHYNLGIGGGNHGAQTGAMLAALEEIFIKEQPDVILVFGDTNSTLAGALAGAKLKIPIAHIEAGLRSFDKTMPEEINRIVTDRLSSILFCPTATAAYNLKNEGITKGVHIVGDVMKDVLLVWQSKHHDKTSILNRFGITEKNYIFVTVHRAENTENADFLNKLLSFLEDTSTHTIFPMHPRSGLLLKNTKWERYFNISHNKLILTEPVSHTETLILVQNARKVLTDSGGLQKEAFLLGTPCITLRETTEWTETLDNEWNILTGKNFTKIKKSLKIPTPQTIKPDLYGNGNAATLITDILLEVFLQHIYSKHNKSKVVQT